MKNFKVFSFIFALTIFLVGAVRVEATGNVYYSVGQNISDHKTGSPTMTISGGIATFSVAQTASNMGVGDRVTYGGSSSCGGNYSFISGKISPTQWNVRTRLGNSPAAVTNVTVTSIRHEFSSLFNAISYYASPSYPVSDACHLNTSDLVTGNFILNIPLYYDSGPDIITGGNSGMVSLVGYPAGARLNTSPSNYIRIYTPTNTGTEVNQGQRHDGKWNSTKYNIRVAPTSATLGGIQLEIPNVRIDGLQIELYNSSAGAGITQYNHVTPYNGVTEISNNIIKGSAASALSPISEGIALYSTSLPSPYVITKVWNNIIYDIKGTQTPAGNGTCSSAIDSYSGGVNYIYNNTIANNNCGFSAKGSGGLFKNNIFQDSTFVDFCFNPVGCSAVSGSTSNISGDTTAPGTNSKTAATVSFVNKIGKDFHLAVGDTTAHGAGADLSGDSNLAFSTDIDGDARTSPWSVGADDGTPPPSTYSLNTSLGSGTGIISGTGISCPGDCNETYPANTWVTLIATPGSGQVFGSWSSGSGTICAGQGSTCTDLMNANKTAVANFNPAFNYSLSNSGDSSVAKAGTDVYVQNTITQSLVAGATQDVTLSLSGVPAGVSSSIANNPCSPNCTSTITFTVTPSALVGTSNITVTGAPLGKTTSFNLIISGAPINMTCSVEPNTAVLGQEVVWTGTVTSGGVQPFTYSWSGTNIPTNPAPSTNPYNKIYGSIGQKTAQLTVTDAEGTQSTCANTILQVNFYPSFQEF